METTPSIPPTRRAVLRNALLTAVGSASVAHLTACSSDQAAPEVEFVKLDGSRTTTAALRGKVTLINFWATSCATCVAEMPALSQTYLKYKDAGYDTIAVAMSYDPPAYVSNFASRRQLPFAVAIDNTGAIAKSFGDIRLTPTTFLLDKQLRVVKRYVGAPDFQALHKLIEQLLRA